MEHKKPTKSEKQYLKGIIHNLSLSRWTDQEIVDYLRDEKKIDIARSTVTGLKNQIEKSAEKWYVELKQSTYKYIATYKERLDSLLSYQKKLNDILDSSKKEETQVRAISVLQSIELDIFNIFLRIEDAKENNDLPDPDPESEVWGSGSTSIDKPRALSEDMYSDEENRDYFGRKMRKYEERINGNTWDTPIPLAHEIKKDNRVTTSTDTDQDKEDNYVWKLE